MTTDNDNAAGPLLPASGAGIAELIPHIEALIFASDKPLSTAEVTELLNSAFGFMDEKLQEAQVAAALEGVVEKYSAEFYPFEVKQSGGGWQFLTKKEFHKTVAQLNGEKFLKRLSAAALETLAIIAYKQPVTKGEIETIRGVSSDYAVEKLLGKDLIIISGRNEKLPGHPLVYSTSKNFMDYFGINSADDLPKIREVLPEIIEPTPVLSPSGEEIPVEPSETELLAETATAMVVTQNGELEEEVPDASSAQSQFDAQSPEEEISEEDGGENENDDEVDDANSKDDR